MGRTFAITVMAGMSSMPPPVQTIARWSPVPLSVMTRGPEGAGGGVGAGTGVGADTTGAAAAVSQSTGSWNDPTKVPEFASVMFVGGAPV